MSEFGLKIKNIKATTILGYNQGIRDRYDYTDAMFCNSLFSYFMKQHKLKSYKDEFTRDIICLQFGFGSRSYEEEKQHLRSTRDSINKDVNLSEEEKDAKLKVIEYLEEKADTFKDKYKKMTKDEVREEFYQNGIDITYENKDKKTGEVTEETIRYVMLYRNPSKAKTGEVMFIREELYDTAYDWITMGIGNKMPEDNAKIVEMSAYAPLSTSTIIGTIQVHLDDVLILEDKDSFFETVADIVRAEDYETTVRAIDEEKTAARREKAMAEGLYNIDGSLKYTPAYSNVTKTMKKCKLVRENTMVKNTLWDGMGIADSSVFKNLPFKVNGMALLRNHFFKACFLNGNIQTFFKDWCEKNNLDYETYTVKDMFGISHPVKNIKMITTNNACKWLKFVDLMGGTKLEAYKYWKKRLKADKYTWGIVKTDHESKLDGNVQQMSYQMINTLPCTRDDVLDIASTSINYVESLKANPDEFERFLRKNANAINHYEMLADLYAQNHEFANAKYFRSEKKKILNEYVFKLRNGKITVNGDNLTVFGNPYALLLHSVGEFDGTDPTFSQEAGTIQCWTKRFDDDEYLAAFRNPHNSANNICYLHNTYSDELNKYFNFSNNVVAVNCIGTDIQARANGMDFDFFV